MHYDIAIRATLEDAPGPLTLRDLVALLDPDSQDWAAYSNIGLTLTRMYRAGLVTREYVRRDDTQRRYFAYQVA